MVERNLAKVEVESSSLFFRYLLFFAYVTENSKNRNNGMIPKMIIRV